MDEDQDDNQLRPAKQAPAARVRGAALKPRDTKAQASSAASLFDDDTVDDLDGLDTYSDAEGLAEIAHGCEAEEVESDDQAFADHGEVELAAQLEAEVCRLTKDMNHSNNRLQ